MSIENAVKTTLKNGKSFFKLRFSANHCDPLLAVKLFLGRVIWCSCLSSSLGCAHLILE